MGFFKIGKKKKVPSDAEVYTGLRMQALQTKAQNLGITLDNNEQVYGAIVDMNIDDALASLVCMINGTTSLYFMKGGGMLGLGQKHEGIAQASSSFLFSAGQILPELIKTDDFDMPNSNEHKAFLLVGDGIYSATLTPDNIENEKKELQFLFFLYNNVLSEIRKVQ